MGSNGASGGSGRGPQELGFTTRDKRSSKQKQKDANVEMGLGKDRMSNYSTSQGGTRQTGGDNNGNQVVQAPVVPVINGNQVVQAPVVPVIPKVVAPTTAEVSQATATDATADTIETRKKKAKATGRSITILNRAKGISSDEGLTLGKRSLLGS